MIDALVCGRVYGTPTQRTGASGKPFTVAKVRAAAGDGGTLFVNVIAFNPAAQSALLVLGDGDSVALSGALTPGVWTDKEGKARAAVDMVAYAVLSAYHVNRKRRAMQPGEPEQEPSPENGLQDDSMPF